MQAFGVAVIYAKARAAVLQ